MKCHTRMVWTSWSIEPVYDNHYGSFRLSVKNTLDTPLFRCVRIYNFRTSLFYAEALLKYWVSSLRGIERLEFMKSICNIPLHSQNQLFFQYKLKEPIYYSSSDRRIGFRQGFVLSIHIPIGKIISQIYTRFLFNNQGLSS